MQNYPQHTDEALYHLVTLDDEKAFEEIYNRYWARLFTHAFKRIKDAEAVREILQDVFAELWVHRAERRINTSFSAYLHTAVRYRILNQIQKEWVRKRYDAVMRREGAFLQNATEETLFLRELSGRLDKLVSGLPPQCRRVFELSRYEYRSNREIAAALNISEKTVENHLTKALRFLKLNLRDLVPLFLLLYGQ